MPNPCPAASRWLIATTRWWRPVTGWICVANLFVATVLLPLIARPMAEGELFAILGFDAVVFGLRSYDKMRGTSPDYSYGAVPVPNTPISEG